jgi:hypothetical protein
MRQNAIHSSKGRLFPIQDGLLNGDGVNLVTPATSS